MGYYFELLMKITILSEFSKLNNQQIVHSKVLYLVHKWSIFLVRFYFILFNNL